MITTLPKTIANKGVLLYLISLGVVSVTFFNYAMGIGFMLLGIVELLGFFLGSNRLLAQWQYISPKRYVNQLFWTAFVIRVIWVFFSYFFYVYYTGKPFEFEAGDSLAYHGEGEWLSHESWKSVIDYLFVHRSGVSDSGYCLYITLVYKLFGPNIIVTRLLKALLGSWMCVLVYKLTTRCIDEKTARMAGVFTMLMPNLIVYCGLHLKEAEMLFLIVAFLERADYVMRCKKVNVINVAVPVLLAFSMFLFRTVLGAVALFSFVTALLFAPRNMMRKGRKVLIALWVVVAVIVLAGGTILNEVEATWNNRESNQETKRLQQTIRGNQWAKYATGTVMAPMVFFLPFSTMADTHQENQLVLHGGNYVRNFMGVFVLIAFFSALFIKKNWRDFALIGSFLVGYLGVISLSGFAGSERFLLPGLPCLIIFWAYGISILNARNYRFVKYWYVIIPFIEIGWAYFKIGSRGLL